jgi:uncharacterized tellurite resistance protein B-like protein
MGSWEELDARQAPTNLTPPVAFVVAMTHMAGADNVYKQEEEGSLAALLPQTGLGGMSYEMLAREVEFYLSQASLGQFLNEAPLILNEDQKLCILLNMLDSALADGDFPPEEEALFNQFLQAFHISKEQIKPYLQSIAIKNRLSVFNP